MTYGLKAEFKHLKEKTEKLIEKIKGEEYTATLGKDNRAVFNQDLLNLMKLLELDELEFTGKLERVELDDGTSKIIVKRRLLPHSVNSKFSVTVQSD